MSSQSVPAAAGPAVRTSGRLPRTGPRGATGGSGPHRSQRPGTGTLLGVWAHPDDEVYLSAGLMTAALRDGQRVAVATATRGELGTDDPASWPPHRLARLRERELAASLAELGVTEHHWLVGDRPLTDGTLATVPEQDGARLVAEVLTEVRPDTIVTFGPDGLTGHADHRAVSRWVTRAWHEAGRPGQLWYATLTAEFLASWGGVCAEVGVWMDGGPPRPARHRDLAHHQVCGGDVLARKYAALVAQPSQTARLIEHVGPETYRQWWATEAFVAAPAAALEEVA
jgi:LmbE family N-acetylglucosaminyl deacetylase